MKNAARFLFWVEPTKMTQNCILYNQRDATYTMLTRDTHLMQQFIYYYA